MWVVNIDGMWEICLGAATGSDNDRAVNGKGVAGSRELVSIIEVAGEADRTIDEGVGM